MQQNNMYSFNTFTLNSKDTQHLLLTCLSDLKQRLEFDIANELNRYQTLTTLQKIQTVQNLNIPRKSSKVSQKAYDTQIVLKNEQQFVQSSQKIEKNRKQKNQTKNIPKNYGKAIITFIQQNKQVVSRCLRNVEQEDVSFKQFLEQLQNRKKDLNSIANLRELWMQNTFKYAKAMRKISLYFMKRGSLRYVFKSRIVNLQGHIKYRQRMMEALQNPQQFTSVKTYNY